MIEADPPAGVKPFVVPVRVRFSDIDGMGHANNAKYLTYLEEARTQWAMESLRLKDLREMEFILAHVAIDFVAPARLGETLHVRMWASRISARSWDFAYVVTDVTGGAVYARARSTQVAYDYKAGRAKPLPESYRENLLRLAPHA